jgi:hypothetical protein
MQELSPARFLQGGGMDDTNVPMSAELQPGDQLADFRTALALKHPFVVRLVELLTARSAWAYHE